jgi:hypothetical protein
MAIEDPYVSRSAADDLAAAIGAALQARRD